MKVRRTKPAELIGNNDWHERVVRLWEEDDALPDGRELPAQAMARLRGKYAQPHALLDAHDGGDCYSQLFSSGFVLTNVHGRYREIGVVVTIEP